jgi:GDP-L-fucose synthase
LAELVAATVGFTGRLVFDTSFPDGTPRKLLDISRLREMGWKAGTQLPEGLAKTYAWFLKSPWVLKAESAQT